MLNTSMEDKVVLVTGATAGIGEITALELARLGATVVGVGRNPDKSGVVASRIKAQTGNMNVEFLIGDLSVMAQVKRIADEFKQKYDRLDVLVNNAGAFFDQRLVSADGIEMTLALNHLSYFLLTQELLDLLKASAPARVVSVSSGAHMGARGVNFDDIELTRRYNGWQAYAQSKLANVLFAYELARRLEGAGVTSNVLHPGFVATNFGHNNGGIMGSALKLIQRVGAKTPEQGAATTIYLASSPEVEGVTGKYWVDKKAVKSSPASHDVAQAQRLWAWSEEKVRALLPATSSMSLA